MTPRVPADWPFAASSRFVRSRPHHWHVQQIGAGPDLLLLHGAGGATHSWRGLAPLLAERHRVTMIDLPGHGYTRLGSSGRSGLDAMAQDIRALCAALDLRPAAIVGHSAGAAIGLWLVQDEPRPLVAINGAFQMFDGLAAWLFPVVAKALAVNPLTPRLFTMGSTPERTRRLLTGTGSVLDHEGLMQMHRLMSDRHHVGGALNMMANWSLTRLLNAVPETRSPVLLIASEGDKAIPAQVSRDLATRLPDARLHLIPTLGHLVHEEAPADVAGAMMGFLSEQVAAA